MKKVIIYPGRFQPMLAHHATVFNKLVADNPDADVYITSSDKTEPGKSPFNFKEKQLVATAQGVDPNRMLQVRRNYHPEDLAPYIEDPDNTAVFFAVGEKDMEDDPRFKFDNMDKKTGLSIKPNGDPYYFQKINTYRTNPKSMMDRGYIQVVNTERDDEKNEILSASAFRKQILDAPDKESAKKVFNRYFKEYNESVFELVYRNIVGEKMNEDLNTILKLAGLDIREDAPVEFDTPVSVKDVKFAPVSKSSAVMSIANRFPEGSDVNDSEVKQEQFVQALLKSPASLLAEINERIMPDENGLAVSDKLNKLIDKMPENGLAGMDDEDNKFALKVVKKAIEDMDLEAGDDRKYDPEEDDFENDSLDLSDIKSEYGIEESDMSLEDKLKDAIEDHKEMIQRYNDGWEKLQNDPEFQKADDNTKDEMIYHATDGINVQDEEDKLEHFEMCLMTHQEEGRTHWSQGEFVHPDTSVRDEIAQELSDMGAWEGDLREGTKKGPKGMIVYDNDEPLSLSDWKHENKKEGGDTWKDEKASKKAYKKYLEIVGKKEVAEGGNAFDIAMTDAEQGIMDCDDEKECLELLNSMKTNITDNADEMMADDVIQSYIDMIEKFGLEKIKAKIDSETNAPEPAEEGVSEAEVEQDPKDPRDTETGITGMQEPEDDSNIDQSVYNRMRQDIDGKDAASIMQKALDTAAGDSNMAPYLQKVMQPLMTKLKDMMSHRKYADKLHQIMVQFDNEMGQKPVMASKEYDESFDPRAEQSREQEAFDELISAYEKDGEEGLCKAIGCSMEELDQEMSELARDNRLHMDDDRDEIIQRYIKDLVDNADWKDHGEQDFDPADAEMEEALNQLRKLSGLGEGGCGSHKKKKK